MHYSSKFIGLTLVIDPIKQSKDLQGNLVRTPGHRIRFKNGNYITTKPKEIEFLKNYKRTHPDVIHRIGEEDTKIIKAVREVMAKVKDKPNPSDSEIIQSIKKEESRPVPKEPEVDVIKEKVEKVVKSKRAGKSRKKKR